jgi:hypothetical protein
MIARSIAYGSDINLLLREVTKKSEELKILRPLLNAATNKDFDRLMSIMKTPGLRTLVYRTDIDIIKLLSTGLKLVSGENKGQASQTKGGN